MQPGNTAVIILAAGLSTRSGSTPKLLATRDGKSVLEMTVKVAAKATDTLPYVVTGNNKSVTSPLLQGIANEVYNPDYQSGMASSIAAGINALPINVTQVVIALADMPFVQPTTYKALIKATDAQPSKDIFVPTFGGERGNPVLWKKALFPALTALSGDVGGRTVLKANTDKVQAVPVGDKGILEDMDTTEDLAKHGFTAKAP